MHPSIPDDNRSEHWLEALERFISETEPEWLQGVKKASIRKIDEIKNQYELDGSTGMCLPTDYETFLRHWGGASFIDLPDKPISITYYSADDMLSGNKLSQGSSDRLYLAIGYQDIDQATELTLLFLPSGETELVLVRRSQDDIKVADSLRQYLYCQAFIAFAGKQYPCRLAYELAFHMHKPPYDLSPEAVAWKEKNGFDYDEDDASLDDLGFNIQAEKLEEILKKHGYQEAWFSTPLDQVWLQKDSFCTISREFDPNDMFDTVIGQLCTCDYTAVQGVVDDFAKIGYKCVDEKKWRDY